MSRSVAPSSRRRARSVLHVVPATRGDAELLRRLRVRHGDDVVAKRAEPRDHAVVEDFIRAELQWMSARRSYLTISLRNR